MLTSIVLYLLSSKFTFLGTWQSCDLYGTLLSCVNSFSVRQFCWMW